MAAFGSSYPHPTPSRNENFMRFLVTFILLCSLPCAALAAKQTLLITEDQLAQTCKGTGCQLVALEKPWPNNASDSSRQQLKFGHFEFSIPPGASLRIVPIGAALVAKYEHGQKISIHYEYATQFQPDHIVKLYKKASIRIADYPSILFTKTPSDAEPRLIYDRWIWRDAMAGKGLIFNKTEATHVTKSGTVSVYYALTPSSDHESLAYVTDSSEPNSFMLVQLDGFTLGDLEKLIGSIRK